MAPHPGWGPLSGDRTERIDAAGGLPFRWVRTILRDREGTLWILGTALARIQGGGRVWNHTLGAGTSGEVVWSIARDPRGPLLAATDDGAMWVEVGRVTRIPGTEGRRIKNLATDRTGTLGVFRLREDIRGRLWAATTAGLYLRDTKGLWRLFTERDGLLPFGLYGLAFLPDGTAWVHYQEPQGLTRIRVEGDRLTVLAHPEATVAFRVAAPSYLGEGRAHLQVRLLGLEDAWRDADAPLVRYPALPGGRYRLETRAANSDGAFGPVASLDFQVRPPWWLSWWAKGLAGLAILGLGGVIQRLRVAALAGSKAELEALVAERTGELLTRNKDLSSALGRVKQLSGLLPSAPAARRSGTTRATGISSSITSATTPKWTSPTASARIAWEAYTQSRPGEARVGSRACDDLNGPKSNQGFSRSNPR